MIVTFEEFLNEGLKEQKYFGLDKEVLLSLIDDADVGLEDFDDDPTEYLDRIYNDIKEKLNKKTINLYRVIWAKDKKDINTDKLGHHWVSDLADIHEDLLDALFYGVENDGFFDFEDDLFCIHIQTPTKNIDPKKSLYTQCEYPFEQEYYLMDQKGIKIKKIEKFYS
jgi:hypothetical protein